MSATIQEARVSPLGDSDSRDVPPSGFRQRWAYMPAARFSGLEIEPRNRIFRYRHPVSLTVEGQDLEIGQARPFEGKAEGEWVGLVWSCSGLDLVSAVPIQTLEGVMKSIQSDLVDLPDAPTSALLVEMVLSDVLARAEKAVESEILCHGLLPGAQARLPANAISLPCRMGSNAFELLLWPGKANPEQRRDFAQFLSRLLDGAKPSWSRLPPPVGVAFVAGRMSLALQLLRTLSLGDVLVPDTFPLAENQIDVLIGGRRHSRAKLEGTDLKLLSIPRRRQPEEPRRVNSSNDKAPGAGPDIPENIEAIDIDLAFEVGRTTVELTELRSLAPGYVFALGRDPKTSVDVMANGRRIGRGEIVSIGDTLGVRIVRLTGQQG